MKVQEMIDLGNGHLIEIGMANWDRSQTSVRNRYPTSTASYAPRTSNEIPLCDVEPIVIALADRDLFEISAATRLIESLVASLARRAHNPPPVPPAPKFAALTNRRKDALLELPIADVDTDVDTDTDLDIHLTARNGSDLPADGRRCGSFADFSVR